MTRGAVLLGLVMTVFLTGGVRAQADDMAEVETAARRLAGLRSYSFRLSYVAAGIPLMRTHYLIDGGWERGIAYMSTEGRGGRFEFYLVDDRTVVRRPGGQWEIPTMGDQGRGVRKGGGGGVSGVGLPSQDLDEVRTKFTSMRRSERSQVVDSKACVLYEGHLSEEAVRAITRTLAFPVETSGAQAAATIWIDGDGIIRKYAMEASPKVLFLGVAVTVKVSKTVGVGDIDAIEVRPPAEVLRLLNPER